MSVQLQGDLPPGSPRQASKSTKEMILDEKDQIHLKLRKEDGHKTMEIGISCLFMGMREGFREPS